MSQPPPPGRCETCRHFVDRPHDLEAQLVGLTILSSAFGDTRGDQGLCEVHRQLLTPKLSCLHFSPRDGGSALRPG
jgi:hypothetical protein